MYRVEDSCRYFYMNIGIKPLHLIDFELLFDLETREPHEPLLVIP